MSNASSLHKNQPFFCYDLLSESDDEEEENVNVNNNKERNDSSVQQPVPLEITTECFVEVEDVDGEQDIIALSSPLNKSEDASSSAWFCNHEENQTYSLESASGLFPDFTIPVSQYDSLYPHQRSGIQFLASMHKKGVGGILGDDMGLGKTRMTLTYLGGLMKTKTIRNALVVAPVSVLRSWEKEASTVLLKQASLPGVSIVVVSSAIPKKHRARLLQNALRCSVNRPTLIITTYGMVRESTVLFSHRGAFFDYAILDEGHTIKNPNAAISLACRSICGHNTRRLLLSGTPIMNNLRELWAVFDWATAGSVLGDLKQFTQQFATSIEGARDAHASRGVIQAGNRAAARLQDKLRPHFLQRLKADIFAEQLPTKTEIVLWTHLTAKQRTMYTEFVNDRDGMVRSILLGETENSPLTAITWLKKLCGHPLLIEQPKEALKEALSDMDIDEILESSAKLKLLVDLVQELTFAGHKTLIFSQSTRILDVIERVLLINTARIDGSTREEERQFRVDEFNSGHKLDAMLLSTKAAGVGLTLTGADRVIVFDPSWTPAEDSQAVDRCYRIGQTKPVVVHRMMAAGTVEEKIYEKQIYKDGIRRTVFTEGTAPIARYYDRNELRRLFMLGERGECAVMEKIKDQETDWTDYADLVSHPDVVGLSRHYGFYMADDVDDSADDEAIDLLESDDDDSILVSIVDLDASSDSDASYEDNAASVNDSSDDDVEDLDDGKSIEPIDLTSTEKENVSQDTFTRATDLFAQGKPKRSMKLLLSILENDADNLSAKQHDELHNMISIQQRLLGLTID